MAGDAKGWGTRGLVPDAKVGTRLRGKYLHGCYENRRHRMTPYTKSHWTGPVENGKRRRRRTGKRVKECMRGRALGSQKQGNRGKQAGWGREKPLLNERQT